MSLWYVRASLNHNFYQNGVGCHRHKSVISHHFKVWWRHAVTSLWRVRASSNCHFYQSCQLRLKSTKQIDESLAAAAALFSKIKESMSNRKFYKLSFYWFLIFIFAPFSKATAKNNPGLFLGRIFIGPIISLLGPIIFFGGCRFGKERLR